VKVVETGAVITQNISVSYEETELMRIISSVYVGAEAPLYLALLPPDVESPRGCYVWCNKAVVDWVNGPTPSQY
jgi:carbonyl reductase 1